MPQQRPSTAPQNLKIAIEPQLWVCVCVKLTSVSSLLHWMTSQQHLFPLLSFFLLLYDSLPHWNSLLGELQSFSDLLKMYLQMEWWTDKLGGLDSASSSKLSSCRFFFFSNTSFWKFLFLHLKNTLGTKDHEEAWLQALFVFAGCSLCLGHRAMFK